MRNKLKNKIENLKVFQLSKDCLALLNKLTIYQKLNFAYLRYYHLVHLGL